MTNQLTPQKKRNTLDYVMNKIYYKVHLHLRCRPVTSPLLSAGIQTHQLSYTHVSIFYDCHRIERSLCLRFMTATDRKKLVFVFYSLCIFATGSKGPCVSLLTRVILELLVLLASTSVAAILTPFAPETRTIFVFILTMI